MATKPSAPATTIDAAPGTAMVSWKDKMAAVVAQAAASEAPKGGYLSFKGGNMAMGDDLIPGNKIEVVVIDFVLENTFFPEKYNPMKKAYPTCYAMGRDEADLVPHDEAPEPENTKCGISGQEGCCPMNEWASDPDGGKGKACKNSRRIAVIDADSVRQGPDAIRKAGVMQMSIPSTSIKNFSTYINQCTKVLGKPPFGVVVELSVKPHPQYLYQVHWKVLEEITSDELLEALYNRHVGVEKQMFAPYSAPTEEEAPPAKTSKKF